MNIALVGGLDRARMRFVELAARSGHVLETHNGDVGGRGSAGLASLVERSEVVVIVIEMNSHGGVLFAKDLARRAGRQVILVRRPSVSALARVFEQLGTRAA